LTERSGVSFFPFPGAVADNEEVVWREDELVTNQEHHWSLERRMIRTITALIISQGCIFELQGKPDIDSGF
jgi:hypothetical protein